MIVLKIKDKNTKQERIHKVGALPCTIGRSLKNNIIIDDDSISGQHASIENNENGIYLKDLSSTNGSKVNNVNIDQHYIHSNTEFLLGEIEVEVLLDDEYLEKTRIIKIPEEFYARPVREQKRNIGISALILTILIILNKYLLAPLRKDDIPELMRDLFLSFLVLTLLAVFASVVSKVHSKKYKLISFMEVFAGVVAGSYLYDSVRSYIIFYSNNRIFTNALDFTFYTGIFYCSLFLLLSIFFKDKHKKTIHLYISSCYVALLLFVFISKTFNDKDLQFNYNASYEFSPFQYNQEDYPFSSVQSKMEQSFLELDQYRIKKNEEKATELEEYNKANP